METTAGRVAGGGWRPICNLEQLWISPGWRKESAQRIAPVGLIQAHPSYGEEITILSKG